MHKVYINGHFLSQRVTGTQRYAREILAGFDRGGYPYTILQASPPFSSTKVTRHLWEQVLLPRKLEKDAVLWSPTNTGPVYAGNHVITLHDVSDFYNPEWFSSYYVYWKKVLVPRMISRASMVITVSEFSKTIICQYLNVSPQDVHVVYNGVDTSRFKPTDSASIKKIGAKYDLSTPYFLTLGSLDPRKNFGRLAEAWNLCIEKEGLRGYSLAIAGGHHSNFKNFEITKSASVKLLGYVDDEDLPALYSGATGFLLPSLFEGFGLPVIEAMACGTPVLTSNTTALDEIAGDAAIKVSPENVDSIQKGIMELVESPRLRSTLTDKGMDRVKLFDWNKTASAIYRYLNGVTA